MKARFQKGEHDCGVACVAMILGIGYRKAENHCADFFYPGDGIYPKDMLEILRTYDVKIKDQGRITRANPVTELKGDALLWGQLLPSRGEIKPQANVHNHWAVWDHNSQAVRDPYGYRKPMRLSKFFRIVRPSA